MTSKEGICDNCGTLVAELYRIPHSSCFVCCPKCERELEKHYEDAEEDGQP